MPTDSKSDGAHLALASLSAANAEGAGGFTAAFADAQREFHGLLETGEESAEPLREAMEQALLQRFPLLREDAVIAVYGTGKVGTCLASLLRRFARGRRASIVFLHTTEATGRVFYEFPVYNIRDIDQVRPDAVVVAALKAADSILAELEKAEYANVPMDILPREFAQLLEVYKANDGRIREPLPVRPGPNRHLEALEPFYIARSGWQTRILLHSFPEIRGKVLGIIDAAYPESAACGIPVYDEVPEDDGGGTPEVRELSEVLLACLRSGEHLEYRPISVRVELSTNCQLDCAGCYMRLEDSGSLGVGNMSLDQIETLLELNPQIREMELSNSGEVFMNPQFADILALLHRHGVKSQLWNGVNFNYAPDAALRALVECGVDTITVSIDGVTQEVYEQYRRRGSIDKVYDNIRRLNALKEEAHSETPHLRWQFILMNHNQHEAAAAVSKAQELGMDIDFHPDWRGGFTPDDPEELSRITGLAYAEGNEYASHEGHGFLSNELCGEMILSPQINWDGRVLGCCVNFKSDWGINAYETPLGELLDNANYRAAVISLLSGEDTRDHVGPCRSCATFKDNVVYRHYALALN